VNSIKLQKNLVYYHLNISKEYDSEVINHPYLLEQKEIISVSAIIHDMCDKKYMSEENGINEMKLFMFLLKLFINLFEKLYPKGLPVGSSEPLLFATYF
jgi:hypothetical protein